MLRALTAVAALLLCAPAPAAARSVELVRTGVFALRTDLLVRALAKEMCSCRNVARVGAGGTAAESMALCLERARLPMTPGLIELLTDAEVSHDATEFELEPSFLGRIAGLFEGEGAIAVYDPAAPRFGCRLRPPAALTAPEGTPGPPEE
jgi:hypothetical protein